MLNCSGVRSAYWSIGHYNCEITKSGRSTKPNSSKNNNGIRAGAKAGPADYLHPETRKVAVGDLRVDLVQTLSQGPGAHPGEAATRYRVPANIKIQACNFRKSWFASRYNTMVLREGVIFFGFSWRF